MLLRGAVLLSFDKHWACPHCATTSVTHEMRPHVEYHLCRGMKGLLTPMIDARLVEARRVKVHTVEREDYIGKEDVQYDGEKRPIMATVVTTEDSESRAIYAPTATFDRSDLYG